MTVSPIGGSDWTTPSSSDSDSSTNAQISEFFTLLMAQMKYQDPMEPMTNQEMMAQFAQLTTVQELQNMTKSLEEMTTSNTLSNATTLVGKTVVATDDNENTIQGVVEMVMIGDDSKITLIVNGEELEMQYVDVIYDSSYDSSTALEQITATNTLSYASGLIGKYLESEKEDGTTNNGYVESVVVSDSNIYLVVNGAEVALGEITRVMASAPESEEESQEET